MKVLLTNGSPHQKGCTYTALCEVSQALNDNGIDTDMFWIGNKSIRGCIGCHACAKTGKCVFADDTVDEFLNLAGDYDGFVFGTPVHWGGACGAITSFLDRVFYADLNAGTNRFLLKPAAARVLVKALRDEVGLPVHLHTHDTSGISAATVLAAIDAGVDAVDAAMDAMSGMTAQPCLGSIVEALRHGERDPGLDPEAIRRISFYWEAVRQQYAAFESDLKSGASEVYLHEMPGGQFTNLKEQARSLGLDTRWHEVARAYRSANDLFGDIVKVTPSSKVVGDMALMMVAQDLTPADVLDPAREIAFPTSVVEMMHGDLGQPPGGWPQALQKKVLKNVEPITARPGALLAEADLAALRAEAEKKCGRQLSEAEFASYLMYPKVFTEFNTLARRYGPVSVLPTPTFFYGMEPGQEITVEIERGKTLVVRLLTLGEADEEGQVKVFFELNGQQRIIKVPNRKLAAKVVSRRKADEGNDAHVAAPMPGLVVTIAVKPGQAIKAGDVIATLEAMKMEMALHAPRDGVVKEVLVNAGQSVDAKDLMVVLE